MNDFKTLNGIVE